MDRYLSVEQIERFLRVHLEQYPDAIERIHFVMQHPFRDNEKLIYRNLFEMRKTVESLDFYQEYLKNSPSDSHHEALRDILNYAADMLGPIGSRKIEE